MNNHIILVDTSDNPIGTEEKLQAHKIGLLHRAFSICIFDQNNQMLLAQRAKTKYHSGGLWSNACCSHPRPGEILEDACQRRLQEELGFSCSVTKQFDFIYKAVITKDGLIEHEFDHVFFGFVKTPFIIQPNPEEVGAIAWVDTQKIHELIKQSPKQYASWFILLMKQLQTKAI